MREALPDVLDCGLAVVFCGINPGKAAAAAGYNFVGRSNRFWRTVHLAGFTPVLLRAEQDRSFLKYGCGITTAVTRPTRSAAELKRSELSAAIEPLRRKIEFYGPKTIAFLGKSAYAAIAARRGIAWGRQSDSFAGSRVWVLPNPSGLNRGFSLDQLVEAYRTLKIAIAGDFKAEPKGPVPAAG